MKRYIVLALVPIMFAGVALAKADADSSRAKHGWLGVYSEELSAAMLVALNIDNGVLVTGVADESPAKTAGLAIGDVITSVGGEKVKSVLELRREVRKHPDEKVALSLVRRGSTKRLDVTIAAREQPDVAPDFQWQDLTGDAMSETKRAIKIVGPKVEREIELGGGALDELRAEMHELRRQLDSLRTEMKKKD